MIIFLYIQLILFKYILAENIFSEDRQSSVVLLSNLTKFDYNEIRNFVVFGYL